MIAKQIKGQSFRRALNYLAEKAGSRYIGGNMAGRNAAELAIEFQAIHQARNPNLPKPVYHVSLSVPAHEALDDDTWNEIAADYLTGMGFDDNQYAVYRHHDTDHDHVHIVASRIRMLEGDTVTDSWNYLRSQLLLRQLEQQHQLQAVPASWETGKQAQTTGEFRELARTGQTSIRQTLQQLLDQAAQDSNTLPDYISQAQKKGVQVQVKSTAKGDKGISYQLNGTAFSGTHLGRNYTFAGLQNHKGLSYSPAQDDVVIIQLLEAEQPIAVQGDRLAPDPTPLQSAQRVLNIAAQYFGMQTYNTQQRPIELIAPHQWQLGWDQYRFHYSQNKAATQRSFVIAATDGRGELLRSSRDERTGGDRIESSQGLTTEDIRRFEWLDQWMQEQAQPSQQVQTKPYTGRSRQRGRQRQLAR